MGLFARVGGRFFKTPLSDELKFSIELVVGEILKNRPPTRANGLF